MKTLNDKFTQYLWKGSWLQISASAGGILLVLTLVLFRIFDSGTCNEGGRCWAGIFADFLDPAIAIGTLIVAGMVWWNEKQENWRAQWPKRLHVIYLREENGLWKQNVIVIDAPLAHEADIRSWGQSIAKTVLGAKIGNISFTGFKIVPEIVDTNSGTKHFGLLIYMKEKIASIEDGEVFRFDGDGSQSARLTELPQSPHPIHQFITYIPQP